MSDDAIYTAQTPRHVEWPDGVIRRFVETPAGTIHCAIAGGDATREKERRTFYCSTRPHARGRSTARCCLAGPTATDDRDRHGRLRRFLRAALGYRLDRAVGGGRPGAARRTRGRASASGRAPHRRGRRHRDGGPRPRPRDSLVLSCSPFDERRARAAHLEAGAIVDNVTPQPDGSHVAELWRARAGFYPEGRVDLLEAFLIDALKAGPRAAEGHQVVARYDMQAAVRGLRCPVLLLGRHRRPVRISGARADAGRASRCPGRGDRGRDGAAARSAPGAVRGRRRTVPRRD